MVKRQVLLWVGMALVFSSYATIDHHPKNAGTTTARNVSGEASEGHYFNPALLGVDRLPRGSFLIPPFTDVGAGYWSDKLALRPYRGWWSGEPRTYADIVSRILMESFRTEGIRDPDEAARLVSSRLDGGVKMYGGARTSLFALAYGFVGFDVSTRADFQANLPEGLMQMIFPYGNKGMVTGAHLDFSDLRLEAISATDLSLSLGLPVEIPVLHDLFGLSRGAGGVGLKYVMGHGYFRGFTDGATLALGERGWSIDGEVTFQQAGLGLRGPWRFEGPFADGASLPVAGHGIGVQAGGILYGDHASFTVNFDNLGVIFWINDITDVTYRLRKDNLTVYDIIRGIDEGGDDADEQILTIFDRNRGEQFPTSADTLDAANGFATILPLALNIGYSYRWDFENTPTQGMRFLADYITSSANYRQQFTRNPGHSFAPRLSLGTEFGLVRSFVPVRVGLVLGGAEKVASAFGAGFNFHYFSLNAAYKAIGTPFWAPKRGLELMAGVNFNMGVRRLKPPPEPEPSDRDGDGIVDELDQCPDDPEDFDGFEDEDGCPDPDNDGDGIADFADECPDDPEDIDGFEDEDGCPDLDNDRDGIPDALDECPLHPEDFDGFRDSDGCPEYDNDKDGIPNSRDKCPNEPEVYNGYRDHDGCPDTLAKPTRKEEEVLNTNLQSINFMTGSAELTSNSFTSLNFVVGFLRQYPHLRYEIQGHTDSQGSAPYNLLLSAARAATVRDYLVHMGISPESAIAIGYGLERPIADNRTAQGRARNRRVQFRIIETEDEYQMLLKRQEEFRPRIIEAKIKGVGKQY